MGLVVRSHVTSLTYVHERGVYTRSKRGERGGGRKREGGREGAAAAAAGKLAYR